MDVRLYLAGSVVGRSAKDVREERQAAAEAVRARGWIPVDPLAGEHTTLKGRRNIQDDHAELTPANIARKDRYAIEHSDMLLWLTADTPSYGSCIEVGFAWGLSKPVIAVDAAGHGRRSAFVSHIATCIVNTLEEALDFIQVYMVVPEILPGARSGEADE